MADHAASSRGLSLSDSAYDVLRHLVEKILPGMGALYFALDTIWGFGKAEQVVGTCAALAVFGGVLLSLSRRAYSSGGQEYDGNVVEGLNDDGELVYRLELKSGVANEILSKEQVVFKGLDHSL